MKKQLLKYNMKNNRYLHEKRNQTISTRNAHNIYCINNIIRKRKNDKLQNKQNIGIPTIKMRMTSA